MTKSILAAFVLLLAAVASAGATDLAARGGTERRAERARTDRSAIVVSGCDERRPMVLGCVPRDELFYPQDVDLAVIERSLSQSGRRPYPELFDWRR